MELGLLKQLQENKREKYSLFTPKQVKEIERLDSEKREIKRRLKIIRQDPTCMEINSSLAEEIFELYKKMKKSKNPQKYKLKMSRIAKDTLFSPFDYIMHCIYDCASGQELHDETYLEETRRNVEKDLNEKADSSFKDCASDEID